MMESSFAASMVPRASTRSRCSSGEVVATTMASSRFSPPVAWSSGRPPRPVYRFNKHTLNSEGAIMSKGERLLRRRPLGAGPLMIAIRQIEEVRVK
jgi:hypothetical protein